MGQIKGALEHRKHEKGERLTRKQAILAMCYECNGLEESGIDCECWKCPLYQYHPHRSTETMKKAVFPITG